MFSPVAINVQTKCLTHEKFYFLYCSVGWISSQSWHFCTVRFTYTSSAHRKQEKQIVQSLGSHTEPHSLWSIKYSWCCQFWNVGTFLANTVSFTGFQNWNFFRLALKIGYRKTYYLYGNLRGESSAKTFVFVKLFDFECKMKVLDIFQKGP